ncbi:hypothetical protein JHC09_03655 [Devosia sp. MC532]|uniref:hypothetical protein n=1 Tax=Devosia sp. MC532 TaxID=2799788 RepID=UPI0018F41143|nr:hypothetical protein [Devosia sp. MC532]MBJ7576979.1 hypothetical protein [Devosia sp. MC532]
MHMKSAISIFALTVGMMVVPAMAQDAKTISGNPVIEGDVAAVQAKCDEIALAAGGSSEMNATENNTLSDAAAGGVANVEPTGGDKPAAEGLAQATTTIDLSVITLEQCKEGGWVK